MSCCKECGSVVSAGDRFCQECGAAVSAESDSPVQKCLRCGAVISEARGFAKNAVHGLVRQQILAQQTPSLS